MQAVQIDIHGGPEVLQYREIPDPVVGPGQILIRVESASVNWSDTIRRRNDPYPFATELPFIPGGEVAGAVHALGEGVSGPPIGTPVFALVGGDGSGGYAQFALADAAMVIPIPDGLTPDEAAAIMVAGGTAILTLREAGRLAEGESVLVEAAGGGVGSYAIQIAKVLGAGTVIGAAGSEQSRAAALVLGADAVVDYTSPEWTEEVGTATGGSGVDVVLESVGGSMLNQAFSTLSPFGRMVVFGYASGQGGALTPEEQHALFYRPVLNQTITGFNIGLYFGLRPDVAVAALIDLVGMIASRQVTVQIGQRLPLSQARHAHELLESRATTGKVILHPWID